MDFVSSLLLVTFLALVNAIGNTLVSAKIYRPENLRKLQEEVKEYKEQLEAAKKISDAKLMKSLEKRKIYIDTLSKEVSQATLKQTLASLAITLVTFYSMIWLLPQGTVVAVVSTHLWNVQEGLIKLDYVLWFMLSTIFFSTATRKAMGIT